jgi:hypothetical protein
VQEVSTSLINSLSLANNHWARKGQETAERKVRGEPDGLKFRTGAEEGETEGRDEAGAGGNHLAVKGLGGQGRAVVSERGTR